jgi:phosphoadenosine phosphosulfate reductase
MNFFEGAEYIESWTTPEVLRWAWEQFQTKASIGTSFQGAGLVMIDIARREGLGFPVFTLDTGLLFDETRQLRHRLEDFWGITISALEPDYSVDRQSELFGPDLWKSDPDTCCTLRKVIPLQSKLRTLECWITGLRREQSELRSGTGVLEVYEFEPGRDIAKLNPMAAWSRDQIWNYIQERGIPYNPLHDRGYRSIGCHPCTRPADGSRDERAGRWTGFQKTECGIHTFMRRKDTPAQEGSPESAAL